MANGDFDPVKHFKDHSPHGQALKAGSSEEKFLKKLKKNEVEALIAIDQEADARSIARVGAQAY
jgi:hypothetical protein